MAECDACAHQWVAVHPVEAEYLQCPVCQHMTPAPAAPGPMPDGLTRCMACGWFHALDDICHEPCEDNQEGEGWKKL